mmetsp:Transcript_41511/g.89978  ORF Transcript_41511/g.89978 Transcript_41511/m.89978 type:complete len:106 (-) Transcript_41511:29-346(-)
MDDFGTPLAPQDDVARSNPLVIVSHVPNNAKKAWTRLPFFKDDAVRCQATSRVVVDWKFDLPVAIWQFRQHLRGKFSEGNFSEFIKVLNHFPVVLADNLSCKSTS